MIYLDNASTTKVMPEAMKIANECFTQNFGNPSSLHKLGYDAEKVLNDSRKIIADTLFCNPENIIFTHSATFANNLAILGSVSLRRKGNIVVSSLEHPSIMAIAKGLFEKGFDVRYASASRDGIVNAEEVTNLVDENTVLVSVIHINSETGGINDIKAISQACKKKNPKVLIHTDCVQSYAKYNLREILKYADMITASGHKINAPKGAAFLYRRKTVNLRAIYFGSSQEYGLLAGTENVPAIAGMAVAADWYYKNISENFEKLSTLNAYLRNLIAEIDGVVINSSENSAPHILNISVLGYRSEILLHYLEQFGIYVSSGSACSRGKPSHILTAMGLARENVDSALRISMDFQNTTEELDEFCRVLKMAMSSVRREKK